MKNLPAVLGLPWHDMVTSGSFDFARSSICSVRVDSVRKWLCIISSKDNTLVVMWIKTQYSTRWLWQSSSNISIKKSSRVEKSCNTGLTPTPLYRQLIGHSQLREGGEGGERRGRRHVSLNYITVTFDKTTHACCCWQSCSSQISHWALVSLWFKLM